MKKYKYSNELHGYKPKQPPPPPPPPEAEKRRPIVPTWIVVIFFINLCAMVSGLIFATAVRDRNLTASNGNKAVAQSVYTPTPFQPWTNTPEPTVTFLPTRTAWPTNQPTSTEDADDYVIVPKIVKETIIIYVLPTQEPATMTPYPSKTPSPTPNKELIAMIAQITQEAHNQNIANQKERQTMHLNWMGIALLWALVGILIMVILAVFFVILKAAVKELLPKTVKMKDTEQSRDDIISKKGISQDEQDMRDLIEKSIQIYGDGAQRLAGHREMDWSPEKWTRVKDLFKEAGISIVEHRGQGTFITRHSLRVVQYKLKKGLITPSPPDYPQALSSNAQV